MENIKKIRGKTSQEEFRKEKINDMVSDKTYRDFEKMNSKNPTGNISTLVKIADALNLSTDYLLDRSDFTSIDHSFIGKETGLSDKAIIGLKVMYEQKTSKGGDNRPLSIVNFLLECFVTGDSGKLFTSLYDLFQLDYQIPVFFSGNSFKPPAHSNRLERSINYTTSGSPKLHLSKNNNTNDAIPVQIDEAFLETVLMNRIKDAISDLRKDYVVNNS